MFNINDILYHKENQQYSCTYNANSALEAQEIQAKYLGMVRQKYGFAAEIIINGARVTISTNEQIITQKVAEYINKKHFTPPLQVYVFYGYSKIGLPSRWCVGFNTNNPIQLTSLLNMQGRTVMADNAPQNWVDKTGTSYSIVLLTGVFDENPVNETEDLWNTRVNSCLKAIDETTLRSLQFTIVK